MALNRSSKKSLLPLLAVLVGSTVAGGVSPFTKIVLTVFPPMTYTLIRFACAFTFLVIMTRKIPKINRQTLPVIGLSLLSTLNIILFAYGIKLTTATVGQALYAAVPVFAVILTTVILKEKLSFRTAFGVICGLGGFSIIVLLPVIGKGNIIQGNFYGNLLIMVGVASYSFYTVLSKRYQKTYSPAELTLYFFLTTIFA